MGGSDVYPKPFFMFATLVANCVPRPNVGEVCKPFVSHGGGESDQRRPQGSEERPAQTVGQRKVWFDSPGVLSVKLIPVEPIVPVYGSARGQRVALAVEIIICNHIRNHAVQSQQRSVVLCCVQWFRRIDERM